MAKLTPKSWLSDPEIADWMARRNPLCTAERLDARTPVYIELLHALPRQQQLIVAVAARLERFSVKELAQEAGLPRGPVSAQLTRLVRDGWLVRSGGRQLGKYEFESEELRLFVLMRTGRLRLFRVVSAAS